MEKLFGAVKFDASGNIVNSADENANSGSPDASMPTSPTPPAESSTPTPALPVTPKIPKTADAPDASDAPASSDAPIETNSFRMDIMVEDDSPEDFKGIFSDASGKNPKKIIKPIKSAIFQNDKDFQGRTITSKESVFEVSDELLEAKKEQEESEQAEEQAKKAEESAKRVKKAWNTGDASSTSNASDDKPVRSTNFSGTSNASKVSESQPAGIFTAPAKPGVFQKLFGSLKASFKKSKPAAAKAPESPKTSNTPDGSADKQKTT